MTKTISALVVGGEATGGPPLGPALGPLGVNVMAVVKEINDKTKDYAGMRVPVKIDVDPDTKSFTVEVGTPTASALLVKEAKVEKGSKTAGKEDIGNITWDQLLKVARIRLDGSYATDLKSVAKEVVGTCLSMGITIEGRKPRDMLREIDEGKYEGRFN